MDATDQWIEACQALGASPDDMLVFIEVAMELGEKQAWITGSEIAHAGIELLKAGAPFVPTWEQAERWGRAVWMAVRGRDDHVPGSLGAEMQKTFAGLAGALWQKKLTMMRLPATAVSAA